MRGSSALIDAGDYDGDAYILLYDGLRKQAEFGCSYN
jgi:hypothetical protein